MNSSTSQDIFVVSSGGVGSKLLLKSLFPEKSPRELNALHLHARNPKRWTNRNLQFIYLFGDPRNAVISFFNRRKTLSPQHGFGSGSQQKNSGDSEFVTKHLKNIGIADEIADPSWTLEDYLANTGTDIFELEQHFDRWNWMGGLQENIVYLRYETLWNYPQDIAKYLGRDRLELPEYLPRSARWQDLPIDQRTQLDQRYGSFAKRLENLPPLFRKHKQFVTSPLPGVKRFEFGGKVGMLSSVNTLINAFSDVETGATKKFSISNANFLYGRFEDFFIDPFGLTPAPEAGQLITNPSGIASPRRFIPAKEMAGCPFAREKAIARNSLLMPIENRKRVNGLIQKYLKPSKSIAQLAAKEITRYKMQDNLALHIRGPGRLDGGTGWMLWRMGYDTVPYQEYFKLVDQYLEQHDVGIVVFSDATEVIESVRERYGDRVKWRAESQRIEGGEGHVRSEIEDKKKLGTDILVECNMMAAAKFFVHGNSNIANYVTCLNPTLQHTDIFEQFYKTNYFGKWKTLRRSLAARIRSYP